MGRLPYDEVVPVIEALVSTEPESWAATFSSLARMHEEREDWLLAYEYYRVARYPGPSSPGKKEAYRRSLDCFARGTESFDPPLERVEIPFEAGPVVCYVRRPHRAERPPVVLRTGGIDGYKEDHALMSDAYVAAGLATVMFDMPGVGESPVRFSPDAVRIWDGVFEWIAPRSDLDAERVAVAGASTGGYFAALLAHTRRDRIRAAVDHGGPSHHAFQRDWIEHAERGEYPFELAETLARAAGLESCDAWIEYAPSLSLLGLGVVDEPCAPLLLLNGTKDTVFPVDDLYLLLEHGSPKAARFWPTGHMGPVPETTRVTVEWLCRELA